MRHPRESSDVMQAASIEFELSINKVGGPDHVEVEGTLTSPMLDPKMHPTGKLPVHIATRRSGTNSEDGFVLDSFQLGSLLNYLCRQRSIREALEKSLAAHQEMVDPTGEPVVGDVWSWAEVLSIHLRLRDLNNPQADERLRALGFRIDEYKKYAPPPEPPQTETFVAVRLTCDWSPDHTHEVTFRNGVIVGLE